MLRVTQGHLQHSHLIDCIRLTIEFNKKTMRLSCTVFEISSFIFQKLKRSRNSDHAPYRDGFSSLGWDLLCST